MILPTDSNVGTCYALRMLNAWKRQGVHRLGVFSTRKKERLLLLLWWWWHYGIHTHKHIYMCVDTFLSRSMKTCTLRKNRKLIIAYIWKLLVILSNIVFWNHFSF